MNKHLGSSFNDYLIVEHESLARLCEFYVSENTRLRAELGKAREALEKVSTRSFSGVDEANYRIKRWPNMQEVIDTARPAIASIDASKLLEK